MTPANAPPGSGSGSPLSEERAGQIAMSATQGLADVPAGVEPLVERRGTHYVVTFPTNHPVTVRGADFYARVLVDAETGEVKEVLGGH